MEVLVTGRMIAICFLLSLSLTVVKCSFTTDETLDHEIFHVPDLRAICGHYQGVKTISWKCAEQLNIVCGNIHLLHAMMDASTKFPYTGFEFSSKIDWGNFDQCITIDHKYKGGRVLGEYCAEGLIVPEPFENVSDTKSYMIAVCRPDGCNASDYNDITETLFDPSLSTTFLNDRCQKAQPSKPFSLTEIVTLSIFGIVICLMVTSTTYDIYIHKHNLKNCHPLLIAFSVLSNGRKLLHISQHSSLKGQIEVLNGLRVISMMWIVAGHAFMLWEKVPISNRGTWLQYSWTKLLYAGYILTAHLAVDTFFFMSGLLVAFKYFEYKKKSVVSEILSIPQMYIHRYLRLTPPLLMMYLVVISLFNRFGSGPRWNDIKKFADTCINNWAAVFLYVQNYHNYSSVCMPQSWFLSALMQIFWISPAVLIPVSLTLRRPHGFNKAMMELMILNIFFILIPMAHKLCVLYYENEYDSQSRLIDYFMGITLGVFLREKIDKPFLYMINGHIKPAINIIIWTLVIVMMALMVVCFQLIDIYSKYDAKVIFTAMARPIWCFGLSWIVYSCHYGYGGFVNWILCRPTFQILGRLTYCIYIVHQSVIDYILATARGPWYFTDYNAFYLFCGHYTVSVIVAFFWTLAFESPLIVLEKYLGQLYGSAFQRKIVPPQSNEGLQLKNISFSENLSANNVDSESVYRKGNEVI